MIVAQNYTKNLIALNDCGKKPDAPSIQDIR